MRPPAQALAGRTSEITYPGAAEHIRAVISPGHHVRIEVEDNGGPWTPATSGTVRHHGLDIICIVANEWGIDGDYAGRTVWARFDWPKQP